MRRRRGSGPYGRPAGLVAAKPWCMPGEEAQLAGQGADSSAFTGAAETALAGARGYGHNDFKIELARRTIQRTLADAAETA
jgi:xanthine dehydrogenase YagS FAD-binding subunit